MLPGNAPTSLLQLYVKTQQGLIEVLKPSPDDTARFSVGERVNATVTQQLPNGRFAVLVKDQLLDLNLPRNTQPGEEFDLTVVARDPKLTFALSQQPAAAPQSREAALSQAARYLTSLLTGSRNGETKAAVTLQGQTPLIPDGNLDPAAIASRLAGAMSESGLFYESHQAEWVNGQRSLQALLREPQAQLRSSLPMHQEEGSRDVRADTRIGNVVEQLLRGDARTSPEAEAMLKGLVQQQLDTIEQRPVVWQGQAWTGQPLKWQLQLENERGEDGQVDTEAQRWQTWLNLELPRLGPVAITATLFQGQFSLQFSAERPDTLALLRDGQGQLSQQFEAAGLALAGTQFGLSDSDEAPADGA
ncbi:flagellar hook-length control protein FliK [Chitinolyticbacter meiyuanensis]|uniref:flagellar hook-length control protein FliK n=1 Tax=Chitinolyticbacter meiyuanensis TaxID=682798 RepID=UPI0011E5EB27|nr:flagellar hook-length control protein FliK [Chitinolyticbacter meiyuanensis]